ncbi:hypothetical protein HMPREF9123_1515 [Neisseria bacilliformis ATCC BAA-1200]|uniref:Uncharacterized protein n=1 Tax=Neisseria bacilliformis ATCC BAA-1200 TaxID=888742 RepID=F2BCM7_9NEIS|nr:hypothetical protein HMPREF9123_1515 [Neisseria bacilliformis ATCC BAA-1200]
MGLDPPFSSAPVWRGKTRYTSCCPVLRPSENVFSDGLNSRFTPLFPQY